MYLPNVALKSLKQKQQDPCECLEHLYELTANPKGAWKVRVCFIGVTQVWEPLHWFWCLCRGLHRLTAFAVTYLTFPTFPRELYTVYPAWWTKFAYATDDLGRTNTSSNTACLLPLLLLTASSCTWAYCLLLLSLSLLLLPVFLLTRMTTSMDYASRLRPIVMAINFEAVSRTMTRRSSRPVRLFFCACLSASLLGLVRDILIETSDNLRAFRCGGAVEAPAC